MTIARIRRPKLPGVNYHVAADAESNEFDPPRRITGKPACHAWRAVASKPIGQEFGIAPVQVLETISRKEQSRYRSHVPVSRQTVVQPG